METIKRKGKPHPHITFTWPGSSYNEGGEFIEHPNPESRTIDFPEDGVFRGTASQLSRMLELAGILDEFIWRRAQGAVLHDDFSSAKLVQTTLLLRRVIRAKEDFANKLTSSLREETKESHKTIIDFPADLVRKFAAHVLALLKKLPEEMREDLKGRLIEELRKDWVVEIEVLDTAPAGN